MKERAAELSLFRASEDKQPLRLSAEPVRAAKKLTASVRKMTIQIVAP